MVWKGWPFFVSRTARPATVRRHVVVTLAQTAAMWIVFLWLLPWAVYFVEGLTPLARLRFDFPHRHLIAAAVFVVYGGIGISSGMLMAIHGAGTPLPVDCPNRLIVIGPYRYVRNPMAMSSLIQGACVGVWLGSPLVIAYALAGALVWNFIVRPWEERDLERRFGAPYLAYKHAVRCWIPRLTPYLLDA